MHSLLYYFWIAPQVLQGVLLGVMFRKRLSKKFPLFTTYLVFDLARFFALFALWFVSRYSGYMWFGISTEVVTTALEFWLICGLSQVSIVGPPELISVFRFSLVLAGVVCVFLAAVVSAMFSVAGYAEVHQVFYRIDLSSTLILTGTLLALFLFIRAFGLGWRSQGFGIAFGFGVSQSVFLAVAALRPLLDRTEWLLLDIIDLGAYHVAVIIWLIYLVRPERIFHFGGDSLRKTDLESWNQELRGMVKS